MANERGKREKGKNQATLRLCWLMQTAESIFPDGLKPTLYAKVGRNICDYMP